MKLWTYQSRDFDITRQQVDVLKSACWGIPNLKAAYQELAIRVGQERYNLIWCVAAPELTFWPDRHEWRLEVSDATWIVNAYIWNKIIGLRSHPPSSLRNEWRSEAIQKKLDIGSYEKSQTENYHSQQEPEGGWWAKLFISDASAEGANILLEPPIPESWIINR